MIPQKRSKRSDRARARARARAPALPRVHSINTISRVHNRRQQGKKNRTLDSPMCSRRALLSTVYRASAIYPAARRSFVFRGNPAISARSSAHQTVPERGTFRINAISLRIINRSPAKSMRNRATFYCIYQYATTPSPRITRLRL